MNRYHDNFHDDFSHTRTEIGSRNRVHLRDLHMGAFAPVAMVVGVFTLAVFVLVAGYFVITQWPLVKTFLLICFYVFAALCAGGVLLLAWAGVNQFRRIHAKTKAVVTYYDAQDLRNHVIETAGGPVLHDPIGRFRAALPPKEILKERYYGSNALPSPAAMDEEGDEPDHGLLEALQERRPVRDYEAMREHLERLLLYNQDAPLKERWIMLGTAKGHIVGAHPGSFLLGGHSGMGKSHLLAYLCCMAVLASGRLLVIDPHCHEREEGLFNKIEPLRPWFIRQPVDFEDIDEVLALFLWLEQEYWNRKKIGGMRGKLPLYIIIDEFNELLSLFDPKQVKVIARIIGNLARGGRKFGMYLIVCAHNWNLAASGGSDVRKNIAGGRIAVGCEPADAAMMLSVDIAEVKPFFSPPLRKGDALIKPAEQRVQRVHFPLNGREHCQGVAEFVAEMIGLPEESLALPEAVTRTADTTANHADTASGVIRSIEDYRLPAHTPTWGQEPDNRGNQGNRKRKQVTQETLDAMVSWRMKGESHRKIRKRVKLEGKYYEELYVPACQQLGLELDPDAPMNPQEWALMKQHYHWTCLACGRREPEIELHPDHIIPRSKGGSDALRNRQPLCKSCNSSKNDSTIDYRKQ